MKSNNSIIHNNQVTADQNTVELKAINLSKTINNNNILKSLNFDIIKGSFTGILGPSGSGKTTLLNILGLMDTYTGLLSIFGLNIDKLSINQKALLRNQKIGFIFQSHMLLPELTILDNIKLPTLISNDNSFNPVEILELVGLKNKLYKLPSELSSGELQRAAFARAVINKPDLILADEPTGNLDKTNKKVIFDLLKDYSKKYSSTIIIATHDEIIENYTGQIIYLEDGTRLNS